MLDGIVGIDEKTACYTCSFLLCRFEQSLYPSAFDHFGIVIQEDEIFALGAFCSKVVKCREIKLCTAFNKETRDGLRMDKYSDLLSKAINSIVNVKKESDIDSFLDGFTGSLFDDKIRGLDDFELICFLVIK